jgi:hypothetical protein
MSPLPPKKKEILEVTMALSFFKALLLRPGIIR